MCELAPLPDGFGETRDALHRVAVHVLARRRHALSGKIGLRAAPGGIGTPAAGPEHEILRTTGALLVRERTGATASRASIDLGTATLRDAAALADVDLSAPFDAGHDTPPVGDPDARLGVDHLAAIVLARWYDLAWSTLDAVASALPPTSTPSVLQLWPEHFDAGCDVGAGAGRVNLGASPGDGFHPEPYLYVGPWGPERRGDAGFWNAPFGAALCHGELLDAPDPEIAAVSFLMRGVELLAG
jgi:hypothetical protein